jgi:hypothetical protein
MAQLTERLWATSDQAGKTGGETSRQRREAAAARLRSRLGDLGHA